jgi:Cys-rich protein (TIGR01571 family)
MSSVYPAPVYSGHPTPVAYPGHGYQQPPTGMYDTQPVAGGNGGYYAAPGAMPPQGSYPPPGYQASQASVPQPSYGAPPPGYVSPAGYGAPPQQHYAPLPGTAWIDPATGLPATYNPAMTGGYPPPYANGTAVAIPIAQVVALDNSLAKPGQGHQPQQDHANRIETGRWSAGLCDCCDNCMPNLCMSWCCPCVSLAQVYTRLGLARYHIILGRLFTLVVTGIVVRFLLPQQDTTPDYSGTWDQNGNYVYENRPPDIMSYVGSVVYLLIHFAFALHVYHARMHVRQRFRIPGSGCCDCAISCCCSCCAIAQMSAHTKSYTPGNCSFGAPDVLPPYQ